MFCPECRTEYVEGITVCVDCNVPLVAELLPEPGPEFVEYEEVLRTSNLVEIALIKSILDEAGIVYCFTQWLPGYGYNDGEPDRLMVKRGQVEEVRRILQDLKDSTPVWPRGEEPEDEE
jgi:hypothetical protein